MSPTPSINKAVYSQIDDLKRLAAGIIRTQGNRFIKDLLRSKQIRLGANKEEFERHLAEAIETGILTLEDIREWLASVEGWGNQHVYLYAISFALGKDLTESKIHKRAISAGFGDLWDGETAMAFPEKPTLTSISLHDSVLRLVWQESSPGWTPVAEKNYTQTEGLDTYEYRAFRQVERRSITRFEAHVNNRIAGLFIPDPIQGLEHKGAVAEAMRVIALLMDRGELERGQMNIATISKNLDQMNIPSNETASSEVKTQRSRLVSGGAYVEFSADSRDRAYWEEPAIQEVRKSVRGGQLPAFQSAEGVFIFQQNNAGLNRPLRVQLYGRDNRIRLWAQMDAKEVWNILAKLASINQ
jgi:hypothetical protein